MLEDSRALSALPPPYLLVHMDLQSPMPLSAAPADPLPSSSASLASWISSAATPGHTVSAAAMLPNSLPIVSYSCCSYEWSVKLTDGSLNFEASLFYIFANACFDWDETHMGWVTSLLSQRHLKSADARAAIAAGPPLPHSCFFTGGRNGILISDRDPTTEAGVAKLFATNHNHGMAYIDRVWHTPYHLHDQCH